MAFCQTQKASDRAYLHYEDGDYDKSFKEYNELVKYDNAEDYYFLAIHYDYGYGVEKNSDAAIRNFRLAADKGDKISQANLSEFYAKKNDYTNLYRYSRMYCTNTDYRSFQNITDDDAKFNLYLCYKNGWGTVKNERLADLWLSFAAADECDDAMDEYCKNHGLNIDDFDSDQAYEHLERMCFKHLYESAKYIVERDSTVESEVFEMWSNIEDPLNFLSKEIDIFYKYDLSIVGKAALYKNGIKAALISYKQLKETNSEKMLPEYKIKMDAIEEDVNEHSDEYEVVSDDDIAAWIGEQLILEMWKIDTILNGTTNQIGMNGDVEWVDLGLPSGTKWASHNAISDGRNLFAWGETIKKKKYSESNYVGDMDQPILKAETDVATLQCGADWSTPTIFDWCELDYYCTCELDGTYIKYKSPNGNSILLPIYYDSELEGCYYWTKSKNTHSFSVRNRPTDQMAIGARLYADPFLDMDYINVWRGCLIRPVLKVK